MKVLGKYEVPEDLLFTKDHEWVKKVQDGFLVGITDFAQAELGDIAFVDLPSPGNALKQREVLLQLESVKAVADVYAPVSGSVVRANDALEDSPQLVNESPYDKGWLVVLAASAFEAEVKALLSPDAYARFIGSSKKK